MKNIFQTTVRAAWMAAVILAVPGPVHGDNRVLSLPGYQARPGTILEVPLSLDNAAGLAGMMVQINFNPEILELQAVTAGPLGAAFEMSRGNADGVVQLVFARAESLVNGSGRLAMLRFRVNDGAVPGLYSELAIANFDLSDSEAVVDLRQKDLLVTTNGMVAVTLSTAIDNANNGLPDWWEQQHGLDLFGANGNLDPEQDGMSNFMEFAFGANPGVSDQHARGPQWGLATAAGQEFISLGFYRRQGDGTLTYRVQESPDLSLWSDLNLLQQAIGTPQDMGDGTEFVNVRGMIPVKGPGAQLRGFMRVVVDKP
jgi:Cohesin domain